MGKRLLVVSNRLPYSLERSADGSLSARPASGGLVSALMPVLRARGGTWIGWAGTDEREDDVRRWAEEQSRQTGCRLMPVTLTSAELQDFYQGFSNAIIWPLFHEFASLCDFDPSYWSAYRQVNARYARTLAEEMAPGDFAWVHDYHLMNVAAELRPLRADARLGFFLHIPFPGPDTFFKLPWRTQLLQALFAYDIVGFQTVRDRNNFMRCLREAQGDVHVEGRGHVVTARSGARSVRVGVFPIGIDFNAYMRQAADAEVAEKAAELHRLLPNRRLVLGIDRLDYTKGIPQRLKAFEAMLERNPSMQGRMSLIQVVVPSREDVAHYDDLKGSIEQLVGRINGRFSRPGGWVPVWYVYGSLTRLELLAYYRAADIALITPLRDGMNLVAKEYCACSIEEDCVLILSEFAGAAEQLSRGALLVNPHDIEQVADTLRFAFEMAAPQRRAMMRRLRRTIRKQDVFWWVERFMEAAYARDLDWFEAPAMETSADPLESLPV